MSGGSWDYFCYKCDDVANQLKESGDPLRKALGIRMSLIAKAMHDIEWVDSSDMGKGDEHEAIKKALGENYKSEVLTILIEDAKKLTEKLNEYTN